MAELTIDYILQNPGKFGLPSFDEYAKNPDKYNIRPDETLACVANGNTILQRDIKRHVYHICGYQVESLEKVETIALDHGWDLAKMDIKPHLEQAGAGKYEIHVNFVLRGEDGQGRQEGLKEESAT